MVKKRNKKKVVIFIEDKLEQLESPILFVEKCLTLAVMRKVKNAPKNKDTKLIIMLLKEETPERSEWLNRIETEINEWKRTLEVEPKIEFVYEKFFWGLHEGEDDKDFESIKDKIDTWCADKDFSLFLDVVLIDDIEEESNMETDVDSISNQKKILSQKLYDTYKDHCVPYTIFDNDGTTFRQKWAGDERPMPYERARFNGGFIDCEIKKLLYAHLRIQEED